MADVLTREAVAAMLTDFIKDAARFPHIWGKTDCGLLLADWCMAVRGGSDPAALLRGQYSTADECIALVGTDFTAVVEGIADGVPLTPQLDFDAFQDGDIAVIEMNPRQRASLFMAGGATGAIRSQGSWVFRTTKGMAWSKLMPDRVIKGWVIIDA